MSNGFMPAAADFLRRSTVDDSIKISHHGVWWLYWMVISVVYELKLRQYSCNH